MRFVTGPDSAIDVGELIATVERSILPVRFDDRFAALEAEVVVLRARVVELERQALPLPPGIDPGHPPG